MHPENGLESVSLVSFGVASGPDSAAEGDNLSKYESALKEMVGPGRVELPTSRLSGVRSNHLSYEPIPSEACVLGICTCKVKQKGKGIK